MRSIASFYRGTQIDVAAIGDYLPQLPGTREEVQQIAAELKTQPDDIRLGLAATETAVKQAKLGQYRIVYFATHGLVSGDLEGFAKTKAEPALALTIPEKPNDFDDGLLTASEIAQLKLDADSGGLIRLQHGGGRQARRGSAVRSGARLLLCGRKIAHGLALERG